MMKNTITLSILVLLLAGCSSSGTQKDLDVHPNFDVSADMAGDAGFDTAGPLKPTKVDEAFKIAYLYMGRPGTKAFGRTELMVMDSLSGKSINVTGKQAWSCSDGCILSPDFKLLGVYVASNKADVPPDLKVYGLDANLQPSAQPLTTIKGVQAAHFSKDALFFTRKGSCPKDQVIDNTFCMYKMTLPMGQNSKETQLFTFPNTTRDANNSVYTGRFRVTPDGTLLLLLPTIYSQRVFTWRKGKLLQVGKEICHQINPTSGTCTGTGSEYTDHDPLGLAPDDSVIVAALLEQNRDLRLRKYELNTDLTTKSSTYSNFFSTPGDFTQLKCVEKLRKPWQYTEIMGDIRFTRDSKSVAFIAAMPCGDNMEKPWTDIVEVAVDRIGTGKPLTRDSIFRVTHNPKGDTPDATMITNFKFSPSGKYIVFIGTPLFQTDGKTPVSGLGTRHKEDREVFIIAADGSALPIQITNTLDRMAVGLWVK